jgi:hypothetical protein
MAQGEGTPTPPEGEQPTQQRPEEAEPEGQAQPEDPSTIPDTQPSGEKPGGGGTAAPTAGDAPKTEEGAGGQRAGGKGSGCNRDRCACEGSTPCEGRGQAA